MVLGSESMTALGRRRAFRKSYFRRIGRLSSERRKQARVRYGRRTLASGCGIGEPLRNVYRTNEKGKKGKEKKEKKTAQGQ